MNLVSHNWMDRIALVLSSSSTVASRTVFVTLFCTTECTSCLISVAEAATSIILVATKVLSRQTRVLSRQKYACRDKTFVAIRVCSRQKYACRDKTVVATKIMFVIIKVLSGHAYFCRDKRHVFVATKTSKLCLS